jgi:hypothetical protein
MITFLNRLGARLNKSRRLIKAAKGFAGWMEKRSNKEGMGTLSYWVVIIIYCIFCLIVVLPILIVLCFLAFLQEVLMDTIPSGKDKDS